MNKAMFDSELQKLHARTDRALENHGVLMKALRDVQDRFDRVIAPIEARIRADAVREVESAPVRKYFVVGKEDEDVRLMKRFDESRKPSRALASILLDELSADDKAEK